jgi:hypothetical protein
LYNKSAQFAKTLAIELKANPNLEEQIIDKIALQIDGDTEILLEHLKLELSSIIPQTEYNLELRMPMAKLWSINSIRKAGGFRIFTYEFSKSARKIDELIGFDVNGNEVKLNKKNYKDFPYLIVARSDRVKENKYTNGDAKGFKTKDINFSNSRHKKSSIELDTEIDDLVKKDTEGKKDYKESVGIDIIWPPAPPKDDEDYWGDHDCSPFCFKRPCTHVRPPPPPTYYPNYVYKNPAIGSYHLYQQSGTATHIDGVTFDYIKIMSDLDDDGYYHWLDGELELVFEIFQADYHVSAGPYSIDANKKQLVNMPEWDHDWEDEANYGMNKRYSLTTMQTSYLPPNFILIDHVFYFKLDEVDISFNEHYLDTHVSMEEIKQQVGQNGGLYQTSTAGVKLNILFGKYNSFY